MSNSPVLRRSAKIRGQQHVYFARRFRSTVESAPRLLRQAMRGSLLWPIRRNENGQKYHAGRTN